MNPDKPRKLLIVDLTPAQHEERLLAEKEALDLIELKEQARKGALK